MKVSEESVWHYTVILMSLLALLTASYFLAHVNLGALNTPVGILIAITKMTLVALYFMHLKRSARVDWVAAAVGLFWLGIMITLTLSDYLTRHWLLLPGNWPGT